MPLDETLQKVNSLLKAQDIEYGFYLLDLSSGQAIEHHANKPFPFASCFKLALLSFLLEQFDEKKLAESLTIKPNDIPPLAMGVINYLQTPFSLTNQNLIHLMYSFSDGTATDLLLKQVGIERVQSFLKSHANESKISNNIRSLLDSLWAESKNIAENSNDIKRGEYLKAIKNVTLLNDYSTAQDLTKILQQLLNKWEKAKPFLIKDQAVQRLGMYAPPHIRFLGKTGTLGYWTNTNDCAIILVNDKPVALVALMTLGWTQPRYIIENTFGEVGRMISSYYSENGIHSAAFG